MRKIIYLNILILFIFTGNAYHVSAAPCSGSCFSGSGCPSNTMLLSGDCGAGQVCCSGKITVPGSASSGSGTAASGGWRSLNFAEFISSVSDINALISSTQGYLNMVAATIAIVFILIGSALYIISAFGKEDLAVLGKKIVIVTSLGFAAVVAAPIVWQEITNIIEKDPGNIAAASPMAKIISNTVVGFLTFVGFYIIISFLFGGFMYFFSAGDKQRMERGKKIVQYAVIGSVIVVGAVIIARSIINLIGGY